MYLSQFKKFQYILIVNYNSLNKLIKINNKQTLNHKEVSPLIILHLFSPYHITQNISVQFILTMPSYTCLSSTGQKTISSVAGIQHQPKCLSPKYRDVKSPNLWYWQPCVNLEVTALLPKVPQSASGLRTLAVIITQCTARKGQRPQM